MGRSLRYPFMSADDRFQELLAEGLNRPFEGWDFSAVHHRNRIDPHPWDYTARVTDLARNARSMVDLGTGGGELLVDLDARPPVTIATEGWMPNVTVAARSLRPIGVHVVAVEGAPDNAQQRFTDVQGRLPFRDASLDVVIDRHEAFRATEVARTLRSGGRFLTQQVGSLNEIELNRALGGVAPCLSPTLEEYVDQLEGAGLEVVDAREAFIAKRYLDIGVLVYFLRAVPWQYEGFDAIRDQEALRRIHDMILRDGSFTAHMHRFLLEAVKP